MRNKEIGDLSAREAHISYDPRFYERLFAVEERHFWFRARNRVINTIVSQTVANLSPGYRVLEIGCGTGNVLRMLEAACPSGVVIGMDLFPEALEYARSRTSSGLVRGDVCAPPFSEPFEFIGLFDVLEHLPDDLSILRNLHSMLAPDGVLCLTVPAHPSIWSYFDEESHHCRRYRLAELEEKLLGTGYRIEFLTHYMASIFPLVWLGRRLKSLINRGASANSARHRTMATNELRVLPLLNNALALVLQQEARWIARRRRLPFGTSLLAVARKDKPT